MKSIILRSPAKLNLYLKILKKRPDGFHNIETLFERIDLYDEISFESNASGRIKIRCNHPHVPAGPKNLVYQAAVLLKQSTNINKGVNIRIKKHIPVAAGLAGGSSNAAATLMGLNKLWNLGLSRHKMIGIAKEIGSDVSFFLHNCSWGIGRQRGDSVARVNIQAKLWHILVVPKVKMYAGEVYGAYKKSLTKNHGNASILIRNLMQNNMLGVSHKMHNDLENPVFRLNPRLRKLKQKLKWLGSKGVLVSGSGPAVFGLTDSRKEAEEIRAVLSRRFSQVFVVRTL